MIIISTIIIITIIITILSQNRPGRCAFSCFSALSLDLSTPNATTGYESAPLLAYRHRLPNTIVACGFIVVEERTKNEKRRISRLNSHKESTIVITFTILPHLLWILLMCCNACVQLFTTLPTDCLKKDNIREGLC